MARAQHDLAGLTSEIHGYDRPLQSVAWRVPGVIELDGDGLRWADGQPTTTVAKPRMLQRFLGLASAPPNQVLQFAREFGTLHRPVVERHGQFQIHATEGAEPLDWWRSLSASAGAVLDIAAAVRNPRARPDLTMWDRVRGVEVSASSTAPWLNVRFEPYGPLGLAVPFALMDWEQTLSTFVASWLGRVNVGFAWSGKRAAGLILNPGGLVGALGLQLAQSLAGTDGLALTCRGCARSYAPRHGNQRYCDECRALREPQRRATKAYRSRR